VSNSTAADSREQTPEDNVFIDLMDFSSILPDPDVGAVLCGLDMHINYKKIARAFRYLRENEGCLFIATNLDSTFPTHGSVYPGECPLPRGEEGSY
jgi:4-nitrophenyl phosphatase